LDEGEPLGRVILTVAGALYGLAAIVLVVACLNVAGILTARAIERGRETAIRSALGATRRRILQQVLAEVTLIAVSGCAVGAALWWICATALPNMSFIVDAGITLVPGRLPLLYCAVLTLVVSLCCAIAPALTSNQMAPSVALKAAGIEFRVIRR